MKTVAVIPSYNDSQTVRSVQWQAGQYVDSTVVVDDGSTDGTNLVGEGILRHSENRGKGAALRTGIKEALQNGADLIVTLDADGQHDPSEIPALLTAMEGSDMVIGKRMRTATMPGLRRWCNGLSSVLLSLVSGRVWYDVHSGFRAYRADLLRDLEINSSRYEVEVELLLKAGRLGRRVVEVPVSTRYGSEQSSFSPFGDTLRFLKAVVVFRLGLDRWSIRRNGKIWWPINWFGGGFRIRGFWKRSAWFRAIGLFRRTWSLKPTRTDLFP